MYHFCTNATETCECGIPRIPISVYSFTCILFETTSTHDILIRLRTKYSQRRLCLPNRLWSILHTVLHQRQFSDRRNPCSMKFVNTYTHVLFAILKSFFSFVGGMVLYMPRGSPNPLMFMCLGASQVVLVVRTCRTYPCRRHGRYGFDPWGRKISWGRAWQPTPVSLPRESHGERSLVGPSPYDPKELDTM